MTAQMERTRSQQLVPDELFDSIVAQVARDTGADTDRAARQVGEALKYLQLVADNPGAGYAVSPEVDHGWHGFILHTRAYRQFCTDLTGGSFIHHDPTPNYGTPKEGPRDRHRHVRLQHARRPRDLGRHGRLLLLQTRNTLQQQSRLRRSPSVACRRPRRRTARPRPAPSGDRGRDVELRTASAGGAQPQRRSAPVFCRQAADGRTPDALNCRALRRRPMQRWALRRREWGFAPRAARRDNQAAVIPTTCPSNRNGPPDKPTDRHGISWLL